MVKFVDTGDKITEKDIEKFEKKFKFKIPKDFKDFLLKYNGGVPKPDTYCNNGWIVGIENIVDLDGLEGCAKNLGHRVPKELIAIGYETGGNMICLGISGKYRNKVYFWDHDEESEDDDNPCYDNLDLLENNFKNFFKNIKEIPKTKFEILVENNDIEQIKKLIDEGMDINAEDDDGDTLYYYSMKLNKQDVLKFLIENKADIDIHFALNSSIRTGRRDVLKYLLSLNVHSSKELDNLLISASNFIYNDETLELLIKNGANVNAKNDQGHTPYYIVLRKMELPDGFEKYIKSKEVLEKYGAVEE